MPAVKRPAFFRLKLMISTSIHAVDSTLLPWPPETIWPLLADMRSYPQWWPAVLLPRVTIPTDGALLGSQLHLRPLATRQFTCTVMAACAPHSIDLEYTGPFITGSGQWALTPEGQGTMLSYRVNVEAHGLLVALAGRCVNLRWMHGQSMNLIFNALRRQFLAT